MIICACTYLFANLNICTLPFGLSAHSFTFELPTVLSCDIAWSAHSLVTSFWSAQLIPWSAHSGVLIPCSAHLAGSSFTAGLFCRLFESAMYGKMASGPVCPPGSHPYGQHSPDIEQKARLWIAFMHGRRDLMGTFSLIQCWVQWIDLLAKMVLDQRTAVYHRRQELRYNSFLPYVPPNDIIAWKEGMEAALRAQEVHLTNIELALQHLRQLLDTRSLEISGPWPPLPVYAGPSRIN